MRKAWLGALLACLVVVAGAGWAGFSLLRAAATTPGPAVAEQRVDVVPGSGLRVVFAQLQARGLIEHPRRFELYLRCCRPGGRGLPAVKAGRYSIPPGLSPLDVLDRLVQGRVVLEQLTVVEGWTFAQFRAALAAHPEVAQTVAQAGDAEVMARLGQDGLFPEGQFAPDTYRFAAGTPDLQILRMAFDAQQRTLQEAWDSRVPDLPLASKAEALVLASVIEKETGLGSERPRIAAVFVNRLRLGMRLQSDPTVIYGIRDRYDGNIRRRDLTTDTPYNTYTRAGLPPTPIALPGRDAIHASLHPEPSDSLYFVAVGDGSGGHYFSATLDEHNRAVARYLQRLRQEPP
jgi:UPF0755 protein